MKQQARPIDRLIEFIQYKGLSDSAFEKTIPLSNGYISKLKKGKGNVGADILQRIKEEYPDLNLTWIVTKVGNMLDNNPDSTQLENKEKTITPIKDSSGSPVSEDVIPVYNIVKRENESNSEKMKNNPIYFMNIPDFGGCVAHAVYTDSMNQSIPSGTRIFCKRIANWKPFLETGRIYDIMLSDERRLLRELQNYDDDGLILIAENPKYKPINLSVKEIDQVWLVEGWLVKAGI